jgi:transposase
MAHAQSLKERGRDFGAWLGLVSRQYSTGGRSILGRITKRGSEYLRTLFIQAANVILMRPHNWERLSPTNLDRPFWQNEP